jgi:hypothetical protein
MFVAADDAFVSEVEEGQKTNNNEVVETNADVIDHLEVRARDYLVSNHQDQQARYEEQAEGRSCADPQPQQGCHSQAVQLINRHVKPVG